MIDTTAGWAGVFEEHRAELVRVAKSRLRGGMDAEDVLHEVLVRVLRSGRGIDAVGAPVAYLRRAVANECVSTWRRAAHEVLVDRLPDRPTDSLADVCLDRLMVRRALGVLTERQRRVVVLTVLEDRTDHEVALLLGVTTVTVRTTRRRALARLRQELTGEELTSTKLTSTKLTSAKLTSAKLTGTKLTGTKLTGTEPAGPPVLAA
jgi:RNA polymerase sigma factor (sigma-70 family)